jgi:uncharacterized phage protein (TIGR02218 family)
MTWETAEASVESSEPIELFEFAVFERLYRYNSGDRDISYEGHIWTTHAGLKRSAIEDNGRIDSGFVDITARSDFTIAAMFDPYPPDEVVTVRIRRLQVGEGDARDQWLGRVLNVSWPSITASKLRCEHHMRSLQRSGLRRKVQQVCGHRLYGNECKADPELHTELITVDAINGRRITSADLAALGSNWASGGVLLWEFPVNQINKRGLWNHDGDHADMTYGLPELQPGTTVAVLRGCPHDYESCGMIFDNQLNHGGFQNFKPRNPFDTPVFI